MCLAYGAIPIAPQNKMLTNYNPVQENGTAFLFNKETKWNCYAAIVRALETYIFPFDWKTIQKQCLKSVM
jgi:glycogen synthase